MNIGAPLVLLGFLFEEHLYMVFCSGLPTPHGQALPSGVQAVQAGPGQRLPVRCTESIALLGS